MLESDEVLSLLSLYRNGMLPSPLMRSFNLYSIIYFTHVSQRRQLSHAWNDQQHHGRCNHYGRLAWQYCNENTRIIKMY